MTVPTITNFTIPTKTFGDSSFLITPPSSTSNGTFIYTSSDESVAIISGSVLTIIGPGKSTITATQSPTEQYSSGTITTTFIVYQSIVTGNDLLFFIIDTNSTVVYGNILNNIETDSKLLSANNKVLFANDSNITIKMKNLQFYSENSNITLLQGICPTNLQNEYLICGTNSDGFGAIYKGTIPTTGIYDTVTFPNSTGTALYGPEYVSDELITIVGTYQTGAVGVTEPCSSFVYKGQYRDFNNSQNYSEITPNDYYNYTVAHSNRAGLAVYISSNYSQLNLIVGKSFIWDIDLKLNICEVFYPESSVTTTYGIWYNGRDTNSYDLYTIAGGFSVGDSIPNISTFVVDFYYNRSTRHQYFENWTKINIPGITLSSHAQGITEIEKDTYILPVTVIYIDISNNYVPISGGKVTIRKANNKYITINYETINYPQSKLTAITSAANNAVTGMYISQSNEQYAMEAVNN